MHHTHHILLSALLLSLFSPTQLPKSVALDNDIWGGNHGRSLDLSGDKVEDLRWLVGAQREDNFRREGMGGPTDTNVTAQRFDLEVIYLGGEKLALRSVAVRDSITNLLMDQGSEGNTYRQKIEREIDTLVCYYSTSNLLRSSTYTTLPMSCPQVRNLFCKKSKERSRCGKGLRRSGMLIVLAKWGGKLLLLD